MTKELITTISLKNLPKLLFVWMSLIGIEAHSQYSDEALNLGIDHLFTNGGWGAGLSLADVNGDGLDDLTFATGSGQSIQVYLQTDDGLELLLDPTLVALTDPVRSINWVDYDNDGDKDLFVTTAQPLDDGYSFELLKQTNSGEFVNITQGSGIDPEFPFSYGSAWADYDRDGYLDLFVSTYERGPQGSNHMYHNLGDGTFEDVTEELQMQDLQGISFTSVFFDADMDGVLDLFTANDRMDSYNTFYHGNPDGTFTDMSVESNLYIDMDAMGAEVGDFDADGDFDLYVTNTYGGVSDLLKGNILFRNDGDLQFTAIGNFPFGVDIGFFWGCSFLDTDFDRDMDLFTVAAWRDIDEEPGLLLFDNIGSGVYTSYSGTEFSNDDGFHFGTAHGDLNNDGWTDMGVLDAFIGRSQVWIASPAENNWIKLHLEGTVSNREAIGSVIEVWADGVKRIDYTSCGNSYASQDSDTYPFGLGSSTQADSVVIHWPNGHVNAAYNLQAGVRYVLLEDTSSYELNNVLECTNALPSPVDLSDTFKPVNDAQDRIQLNWYRDTPEFRYTDADAAACDIQFWAVHELDPITGDPIGQPIIGSEVVEILNTKKFYPDGTPRSIYKWPVKFQAEGANNAKRVVPNRRYEWKVRCACAHGDGPESEWSEINMFDSPDFDTESGEFLGIAPFDDDQDLFKKTEGATDIDFEISPNLISVGEIKVKVRGATGTLNYRILDLAGRAIEIGSLHSNGVGVSIIYPQIELRAASYLLELSSNSVKLTRRFLISD